MPNPTRQEVADKVLTQVMKALPVGMADEIDALDVELLKRRVLMSEDIIRLNKISELSDPDLLQVKDKVKELTAPYREVDKAQKAIVSYALYCIAQKGVDIERNDDYGDE